MGSGDGDLRKKQNKELTSQGSTIRPSSIEKYAKKISRSNSQCDERYFVMMCHFYGFDVLPSGLFFERIVEDKK